LIDLLLIESKNDGFPKIITDVRRCGKTYLLKEIYKQFLITNGVLENSLVLNILTNNTK